MLSMSQWRSTSVWREVTGSVLSLSRHIFLFVRHLKRLHLCCFAPHCAPVTVTIRACQASLCWSLVGLCVYNNAVKVAESRRAALFTSCRPQNIPASAEAEAEQQRRNVRRVPADICRLFGPFFFTQMKASLIIQGSRLPRFLFLSHSQDGSRLYQAAY